MRKSVINAKDMEIKRLKEIIANKQEIIDGKQDLIEDLQKTAASIVGKAENYFRFLMIDRTTFLSVFVDLYIQKLPTYY